MMAAAPAGGQHRATEEHAGVLGVSDGRAREGARKGRAAHRDATTHAPASRGGMACSRGTCTTVSCTRHTHANTLVQRINSSPGTKRAQACTQSAHTAADAARPSPRYLAVRLADGRPARAAAADPSHPPAAASPAAAAAAGAAASARRTAGMHTCHQGRLAQGRRLAHRRVVRQSLAAPPCAP